MKTKISNALITLALAVAVPMLTTAATVTYPLTLGIFGGASVTTNSIEFGTSNNGLSAPYAPPPGYGTFEVNLVNAGPFQNNGVSVGELGMIQSLSVATFPPTLPFMTFNGAGTTPGFHLNATQITAGTVPSGCVASPGPGVFYLCDSSAGATATTNINGTITGDASNPGGTDTYSGVFQATFAGLSLATLESEIMAGPVNSPFSATFTATVTTGVIPEPMTFFLMGIGLVGAGIAVRRNKVRG